MPANPLPDELFSVVTFSLYMSETYHITSSVGFSATKLHTSVFTAILYAFITPYPPINELAIVTALSRQPARPYWKNSFPTGNGHRVRREDCFLNLFVHMQEDSSGPPRAYQGVEPPPVLPFLLKQNPSPKDIV